MKNIQIVKLILTLFSNRSAVQQICRYRLCKNEFILKILELLKVLKKIMDLISFRPGYFIKHNAKTERNEHLGDSLYICMADKFQGKRFYLAQGVFIFLEMS